jgi:Bor protein
MFHMHRAAVLGEFVMRPLILFACAVTLAGCAEHRLVVQRPNPGTPPTQIQSAAIGWGASQKRTVANCDSNIIDEVRVKQNVGQALVSVLTLGFYMPTTIEYVCGNVPSEVGNTDN